MKIPSLAKYRPFPSVSLPDRRWPDQTLNTTPQWCSVDLRDGNQALATPMGPEAKLNLFQTLLDIGFKQIEVGFPSASDTEFAFVRKLIEEDLVPDDVRIQVLVQAREHLIRRTFESIEGAKNVTVHLYNSTSPLQRRITFSNASRGKIKDIAVDGTKLVKELTQTVPDTKVTFQYSPESFSDTEMDYALEICEEVMRVWEPGVNERIILNLPATVEWTTPNVHADQIEWFCRNMRDRDKAWISLHTHNDRGTGTAATELGLLAGADRVEGTLFGNGERTGNLDIATVALNLNSHGIATGLDFSNISAIREVYERTTGMQVPERHPYAGDLVFTAFSGSHQDAIKKGMDLRKDENTDPRWQVPYLTIDPEDIGRTYEAIIRINSQSGKGGVAYVLDREFGIDLPKAMHPEVGKFIYNIADQAGGELSNKQIYDVFIESFVNIPRPNRLIEYELYHDKQKKGIVECAATIERHEEKLEIRGDGNGPINAMVNAFESMGAKNFSVTDYRSNAIGEGSDSSSAAFVQIKMDDVGTHFWGCGIDPSIEMAGLKALFSAINRSAKATKT